MSPAVILVVLIAAAITPVAAALDPGSDMPPAIAAFTDPAISIRWVDPPTIIEPDNDTVIPYEITVRRGTMPTNRMTVRVATDAGTWHANWGIVTNPERHTIAVGPTDGDTFVVHGNVTLTPSRSVLAFRDHELRLHAWTRGVGVAAGTVDAEAAHALAVHWRPGMHIRASEGPILMSRSGGTAGFHVSLLRSEANAPARVDVVSMTAPHGCYVTDNQAHTLHLLPDQSEALVYSVTCDGRWRPGEVAITYLLEAEGQPWADAARSVARWAVELPGQPLRYDSSVDAAGADSAPASGPAVLMACSVLGAFLGHMYGKQRRQ